LTRAPVIAAAEDPASFGSLEHELKYIVPATVTRPLLAWLPSVCLRDTAYPPAAVHSVYYDTPGLALLGEKMDSDYVKAKVRVRWYADLHGRPGPGVFAELKGRIGNRRVKTRVALPIDGATAASRPLHDRAWIEWLRPLTESSGLLPASLAPVLSLRYVRHRFTDPRTTSRLTLDEAIDVDRVNPQRLHGRATGRLAESIVEYKGRHADVPAHLAALLRFHARRSAYSKYLACWQHVTRTAL
jgi:hypothetical protein